MTTGFPDFDQDAGAISLYLEPLGLGPSGDGLSFPLGSGPVSFNALKVILRAKGKRVFEAAFPVANLTELKDQLPEALRGDFDRIFGRLTAPRSAIGPLTFEKPLVMGILNVTPDSFSDGGDFGRPQDALAGAKAMFDAGADIVDAGGESTRPGAKPVTEDEELKRLAPVFETIRDLPGPVSVDTRKAAVMKKAITAGACMINDVSALTYDKGALETAKNAHGVVLMHAKGPPETMQDDPVYDDVLLDVYDFLDARIGACEEAGIGRDRIIVDPGIGFGKTLEHNLALLRGLALFQGLGTPVLIGVSRKRFIGALTGLENPKDRVAGSLAAAEFALHRGANIVRAHDVPETRHMIGIFNALYDNS